MKMLKLTTRLQCLTVFMSIGAFAILFHQPANAQRITGFTEEIENFPFQLHDIIKGQLSKEEEAQSVEFAQFWSTDYFSPEKKAEIVEISNLLLKKTDVNLSHFVSLMKILLNLKYNEQIQKSFETWLNGLKMYAEDPSIGITAIIKFVQNSQSIFENNILKIRPAHKWSTSNGEYSVTLDSVLTFRFGTLDLICSNETDSMVILATQGIYNPLSETWSGKGGKVTWARSKLPVDEIFAMLSNYRIDLTKNEYVADSVWFTNKDYFKTPSLGYIKDRLIKSTKASNVDHPEFHTYGQRYHIDNLFDGVDYDGGYYMVGSKFYGSGTREQPAIILFKRNNKDFLRIESKIYVFQRQSVVSDNAKVRFLIENDSIFHSGLGFTYNDQVRMVAIAPTDFLTTQSPILNTYHNFSINFNQISWNLGTDEIVFGPPIGASQGRASFESNNYFNQESFDQIMGRDDQHPLFAISNFTRQIRSRIFNVNEFSIFMRKPIEQTRIVIMQMAMLGYILYEYETGEIQVLPKLYDAIRARTGRIDYDVIKFQSLTQSRPNAVLNLATLEMEVNGVQNVSVSDSQNVFIYPARNRIILKKNRNFAFDGVVRAGLFTFQGHNFNFNYENFSFVLDEIELLNIDVQTQDYDMYGKRVLEAVTSTLENITGEIFIDQPDNKSGLVNYPEFPIFRSTKNSFVYYDDPSIHKGVYKRDNFFFEIYPFTFSNLNDFEYKDLHFTGLFQSADILGTMEDTLVLRPDNSLGFKRESPEQGFALYQGRGTFYKTIDLSNKGLRGIGEFTYITSRTASDDLYFFPDSVSTLSTSFTIGRRDAGIQFPETIGSQHMVKWQPYNEILYAYRGKKPFEMFEKQSRFTGDLTLTPLGLVGTGLMDMEKARLKSNHFDYNSADYRSAKASAEFNIVGKDSLALSSDNLKAFIDLNARKGDFGKIDQSIYAIMQPMMYESHLDEFEWSMERNELTFSTPDRQQFVEMDKFYVSGMIDRDTLPSGSLFYSTWKGEDSLYFFSSKAKYNLRNPGLKADSVKYLVVADAIIHPYNQKVEVDAKKRVMPLQKSEIVANYIQKYHRIYDADITIKGRKKYYAKGTIDYVDENDSIQKVKLKEVGVDPQGNTYAQTTLTVPDRFKLSPRFGFIGNVDIFARDKIWLFDGGAEPISTCPQIKASNVKFKAPIDPLDILIPVAPQPMNLNNVTLISGSVVTVDSIHLYPGFISGRKEFSDKTLIDADGYLHYNKNRNRFMLGSKNKIHNPDTTGNLIGLATDFCILFSEGTVKFPVNLGQIKNYTTGNLVHKLEDSTLTMDLILSLDFHFNQQSLETMANEIISHPGLSNVDLNRKIFHKALYERTTPAEALAAVNQIKIFGAMSQLPSGFQNTITFSDLKMKWDPSNRSFVSYGKIGIGTIGNISVNKKVDGFIEILKRNTGDWMMMYLQITPEKYYVFYYVKGSMQVSSHNAAFTDPIKAMKSRDRRVKVKAGQIPYNFVVGTKRELQRVRERYSQLTGISFSEDEYEELIFEGNASDTNGVDTEKEDKKGDTTSDDQTP